MPENSAQASKYDSSSFFEEESSPSTDLVQYDSSGFFSNDSETDDSKNQNNAFAPYSDESNFDASLLNNLPSFEQEPVAKKTGSRGLIGEFARTIADVPTYAKGKVASVIEGDTPYAEYNRMDEWRKEAGELLEKRISEPGVNEKILFGYTAKDFRELGNNLAFSTVSMAAGLTGAIAAAPIPVPGTSWAGGGLASGVAAQRMATNEFLTSAVDVKNREREFTGKSPMTDAETKSYTKTIRGLANESGYWEAVPEAIGNVAGLKIITAPLRQFLGKNVASRLVTKLSSVYGVEFATETVTQIGQGNVAVDAGLSDKEKRSFTSPADVFEAFKEIAPATFLLTTVMGGTVGTGVYGYNRTIGDPKKAKIIIASTLEGNLELIPTKKLNTIISSAEDVFNRRKGDEKLKDAISALKGELASRGGTNKDIKQKSDNTEDITAVEGDMPVSTDIDPELVKAGNERIKARFAPDSDVSELVKADNKKIGETEKEISSIDTSDFGKPVRGAKGAAGETENSIDFNESDIEADQEDKLTLVAKNQQGIKDNNSIDFEYVDTKTGEKKAPESASDWFDAAHQIDYETPKQKERSFDELVESHNSRDVRSGLRQLRKQEKELSKGGNDAFSIIAQAGGVDRQSAIDEGVDPEDIKKLKAPVFGKTVFPHNGGRGVDDIGELLHEYGFAGEDGERLDKNAVLEILHAGINGEKTYSPEEAVAQADANATLDYIRPLIKKGESRIKDFKDYKELKEKYGVDVADFMYNNRRDNDSFEEAYNEWEATDNDLNEYENDYTEYTTSLDSVESEKISKEADALARLADLAEEKVGEAQTNAVVDALGTEGVETKDIARALYELVISEDKTNEKGQENRQEQSEPGSNARIAPAQTAPEAETIKPERAKSGNLKKKKLIDKAAHEAATSPENNLVEPATGQKEAETSNIYQLSKTSTESNNKWRNINLERTTPDKKDIKLIESVQKAKESGVKSYREAVDFVRKDLGDFIPENIENGVDGGAVQTEISNAWQYIDNQNFKKKIVETKTKLNFVVGQKIGKITPNTGKMIRGVSIDSITNDGYVVTGVLGNKRAKLTLDAVSLKRAIDRANPEGKKDSESDLLDTFFNDGNDTKNKKPIEVSDHAGNRDKDIAELNAVITFLESQHKTVSGNAPKDHKGNIEFDNGNKVNIGKLNRKKHGQVLQSIASDIKAVKGWVEKVTNGDKSLKDIKAILFENNDTLAKQWANTFNEAAKPLQSNTQTFTTEAAKQAEPTVKSETTPVTDINKSIKTETGKTQEKTKQEEAKTKESNELTATKVLDDAAITGKDRLDAISKFRSGEYTLDDLKAAYPADKTQNKETEVKTDTVDKESKTSQENKIKTGAVIDKADNKAVKSKANQETKKDDMDQVSGEKIEDFGEKIGGSRKDAWSGFREQVGKNLSQDELETLPLSKSFPEPNYKALAANGADKTALAAIKVMRDEIPTKGRTLYKKARYVEAVKLARNTANSILDSDSFADKFISGLRENENLSKLADRIDLLIEFGFPESGASLKGVTLEKVHYTIWNGEKNVTKWVVDVTAKSKESFGGMGGNIIQADTREEAIAALKKHAETIENQPKGKRVTKFDVYKYRGTEGSRGWIIGKKIGRNHADLAEGFETSAEARAYVNENQQEIEDKLEKFKAIPKHRKDVNTARLGEDYRNGKNVTAEEFADTFGFRGVEFGNWVGQEKRQQDINDAYDGLMDLAKLLDIPPKSLSLNGELGLAFGARGIGGKDAAKAHYEQDKIVINLTKKDGAGSLAHEWFHGLDNYFSRIRGEGASFVTERPRELLNKSIRPAMVARFKGISDAIKESGLPKRARILDGKRTKDYWGTMREMAARSFESYVISKLKEKDISNDYLANIVSQEYWEASEALGMEEKDSYPYAQAEELDSINGAYDEFFNEVKTKETEKGTALYSRHSVAQNRKTAPGISLKTAQDAISEFKSQHKGYPFGIKFRVYKDKEAAFGKDEVERLRREEGVTNIGGAYYGNTGEVILIASDLHNFEDALSTLRHEILAHHGLNLFFKAVKQKIIDRIKASRNERSLKKLWAEIDNDYRGQTEDIKAEEVLARIAENKLARLSKLWNDLIQMIRNFLIDKGWLTDKVTKGELIQLVQDISTSIARGADQKTFPESDLHTGLEKAQLSNEADHIFYSQMHRVLADKLQGKGTGASYAKTITAFVNKGQFKKEEYEWSGVDEWLKSNAMKKITKSDVLDYITANQIQIKEVEKGDQYEVVLTGETQYFDSLTDAKNALKRENEWIDEDSSSIDIEDDYISVYDHENEIFRADKDGGEWAYGRVYIDKADLQRGSKDDAIEEANAEVENIKEQWRGEISEEPILTEDGYGDSTKFSNYQLPGGENYTELLLVLPAKTALPRTNYKKIPPVNHEGTVSERKWHIVDGAGNLIETANNEIGANNQLNLLVESSKSRNEYHGTHYDEPNILAHVRFDERIDADGKRVLFLEEVQSDWHQGGRKKGYIKNDGMELIAFREEMKAKYGGDAWWTARNANERDKDVRLVLAANGVPNAPFKTTWPMLIMKRMIREATTRGFDKIAWTTGEQQNEQYDLSKQLDELSVLKRSDGEWIVSGSKDGSQIIQKSTTETGLKDLIGKDLAEKVIKQKKSDSKAVNVVKLKGIDLKVGGEGMKGFYDSMLPKMVNKYVKKWNSRVTGTTIETPGYALGETQAVHAIPITDKMRGSVTQGQPLFSRKGGETHIDSDSQPLTNEETWDTHETLIEKLEAKAIYRWNRIAKLQKKIHGEHNTPAQSDAIKKEATFYGKVGEGFEIIEREYLDPAMEVLKNNGLKRQDLEQWMYAVFAPERNAWVLQIDKSNPKGSGITDAEATAIKNKFSSDEQIALKQAAVHIRAMLDDNMNMLVKHGVITEKIRSTLKKKYPNYVPLQGNKEEEALLSALTGKKFDIRGTGLKRALGRVTPAENILPHAIAKAEAGVIRSEKATVGQAIANLYMDAPDPTIWKLYKVKTKQSVDAQGELFEELLDEISDIGKFASNVTTTKKTLRNGKVVNSIDPAWMNKPHIFAFRMGGDQYYLDIKDEALNRQLKGLGVLESGPLVRVLALVNRYLAAIYTSFNPDFIFTNSMRDIQMAITNIASQTGHLEGMHDNPEKVMKGLKSEVLKNWGPSLKAVWMHERGEGADTEVGKYYNEMRKGGGKVAFYSMRDIESLKARLDRKIKSEGVTKSTINGALDFVSNLNSAVENAVRLSAYMVLRKRKISIQDAAFVVRNLTVDFNRKGESASVANALWLFYNASIQGARVSINVGERLIKSNKGRAFLIGTVATGFMLAEISRQALGEGDDDRDKWDAIPDYMKRRNLLLAYGPGDTDIVKFTLPYGLNLIPNMGYWLNDLMHYGISDGVKGKSPLAVAKEALISTVSATNPIGNVYPTIITPIVDVSIMNENFAGYQINKEHGSFEKPRKPDSETHYPSFNKSWEKTIASTMNSITGGNEYSAGLIDVAPGTIRYAWNYVTGGLGATVGRMAALATDAQTGFENTEPYRIPIIRNFTGGLSKSQVGRDYRKNVQESLEFMEEIKNSTASERKKLIRENRHKFKIGRMAIASEKKLSNIYKMRNRARAADKDKFVEKANSRIKGVQNKFNKVFYAN